VINRLRVAVATPMSADDAAFITARESRIELLREPSLVPPMRHPADFEGDPSFRRSEADQARFEALLDAADALYGVPDGSPLALRRAVVANPRLRWVHTMAAGGGSQVKAAALTSEQLARVRFTTSAGVHGEPLAEFAVFGVLAGAKSLGRLRELQARREWPGRWQMGQVSEQRILVLGLGGIGSRVAHKLHALGAEVIGTSRRDVAVPGVAQVVHPDHIDDVVGSCDAIVVTLPGTDHTVGLVGDAMLHQARPGVTVVNVGRGTVIDEPALIRALKDGRVGFAALDVVSQEPLASDSPLWAMRNVVISPHTSGLTAGEERRIATLFSENAGRLLNGRPLINEVDTVEFY
jgi:phosphoglycerate dehydrogenase-like enzyme